MKFEIVFSDDRMSTPSLVLWFAFGCVATFTMFVFLKDAWGHIMPVVGFVWSAIVGLGMLYYVFDQLIWIIRTTEVKKK